MSDNKPKEYWVDPLHWSDDKYPALDAYLRHPRQGPLAFQERLVHVIEYRALAEAQLEKLACIKAHDENIDLMREFQKLMKTAEIELAREHEIVSVLEEALGTIIDAWKAKQWKGANKYWGALGDTISKSREALAKVKELRGAK